MFSKMSNMKQQAKMLKDQMEKMQKDLKEKRIEGVSANDLVKVIISGEKEIVDIKIDKECLSDVEGLQDLIIDALKKAYSQVEDSTDLSSLKSMFPF